jgi:hypothetical protein
MIRTTLRWTATLAMAAGCVSCSDDSGLNAEREGAVRAEGAAAAQVLMTTLQANLVTSMEEGGPVQAIEFCTTAALALTDSVSDSLGEGISIKRVSEKHRNPENAPDASEIEAIRHFEAALTDNGALPDDWVQKTAAGELRYYRPLTIAPPCLNCHGDPVDMDPRVVEVLQASYPDDQATGYEAGDLRGLIRVSVSEERVNRAIGGY